MKKIIIFSLFIFNMIVIPVFGGNFEKLEHNAKNGDIYSQITLASLYLEKDYSEAAQWFERAANQGSCFAQVSLASLYYKGKLGYKNNYEKAAYWFEKSALHEDVYSQRLLALIYLHGTGSPQNNQKAFHWFEKAAYSGDVESQYQIGLLLIKDSQADLDQLAKGYSWLIVAEKQGRTLPKEIKKNLTSEIVTDAEKIEKEITKIIAQNTKRKQCPNDPSLDLLNKRMKSWN